MAGYSTKTRQTRMIAALLDPANKSQAAACDAVGVPVRTLQNWLLDPEFQADLRQAEQALVSHASRRLLTLTDDAIARLGDNLNEDARATAQLRAAELVLSHVLKWRELGDLEARLSALEARQ